MKNIFFGLAVFTALTASINAFAASPLTVKFDVIQYSGKSSPQVLTAQSVDDWSIGQLSDAVFDIAKQAREANLATQAAVTLDRIATALGTRMVAAINVPGLNYDVAFHDMSRNSLLNSKIMMLRDTARSLRLR